MRHHNRVISGPVDHLIGNRIEGLPYLIPAELQYFLSVYAVNSCIFKKLQTGFEHPIGQRIVGRDRVFRVILKVIFRNDLGGSLANKAVPVFGRYNFSLFCSFDDIPKSDHFSNSFTCLIASAAFSPYPSAPISSAHSGRTGAPPIITLTSLRRSRS